MPLLHPAPISHPPPACSRRYLAPPPPPPCSDLIDLINGPLSKNDRKKLITLCAVDVHARDVVARLIEERVEAGQCFQWQSQLRYAQNDKTKECQVRWVGGEVAAAVVINTHCVVVWLCGCVVVG